MKDVAGHVFYGYQLFWDFAVGSLQARFDCSERSYGLVSTLCLILMRLMARLCLCGLVVKLIQFYLMRNARFNIILRMLRFASRRAVSKLANNVHFSTTRTVGNIDFIENDSFLKIVLNRPKALNSLNLTMIKDLASNLAAISANKAFWVEGAGGKAFCAGGDVKALFDKEAKVEDRLDFFRHQFSLDYKLTQVPALEIANWDGIVMGGGFGISAFSPFRIATQNTMFAMPEAKLGFFTDVGSSHILARMRSNIGYYLGLTGARMKGEDVYISGLANYFLERDSLQPAYEQIKEALPSSKNPKETIHNILSKYHKPSGRTKIAHEEQIQEIFSLGSVQQVYKRVYQDSDKFCQSVVKGLNEQCPFSLGIVHRLIDSAKNKTVKECFLQDYNLVQKAIVSPNFAEGVRTVLVDRGAVPNWSHKHVDQVTEAEVDQYFNFPSTFERLPI